MNLSELIQMLKSSKEVLTKIYEIDMQIELHESKRNEIMAKHTSIINGFGCFMVILPILAGVLIANLFKNAWWLFSILPFFVVFGVLISHLNNIRASRYYQKNAPAVEKIINDYKNQVKILMETESYVHLKTYLTAAYCKLHTVECLMKLLESGRANTLKDALNLYEDILHKARMEELQQQQLLIGQDILKNQDLQKKYAQQTVQSAYLTNGLIVLNYLKSGDNS